MFNLTKWAYGQSYKMALRCFISSYLGRIWITLPNVICARPFRVFSKFFKRVEKVLRGN